MNKNLERRLQKLQGFENRYCNEYLYEKYQRRELESNWWKALEFVFDRVFMRGRGDKLSNEYKTFTICSLRRHFGVSAHSKLRQAESKLERERRLFGANWIREFKARHHLGRKNALTQAAFAREVAARNSLIKTLTTLAKTEIAWHESRDTKEMRLGNDKDVMMVLDVLERISHSSHRNIYHWIMSKLKAGQIDVAFSWLDDISNIGDKLASLVIRDTLFLNPRIALFDYQDYRRAFPVDTWVTQLAPWLGCKSKSKDGVKRFIILSCLEANPVLCPLKVNAGMWYLEFNARRILLESFDLISCSR